MSFRKVLFVIISIVMISQSLSKLVLVAASIDMAELELTTEELSFIQSNQNTVFTVASNVDSSKLYLSRDGQYSGFVYKLFDAINKETGLNFDYYVDEWSEVASMLNHQEVDLLIGTNSDISMLDNMIQTQPIMKKPYWICSDKGYQSILDLKNKNVGFIMASSSYKAFQKNYDININPSFYKTDDTMFEALNNGEVDAIMVLDCLRINQFLNAYHVNRDFQVRELTVELICGSYESNQMLLSIINKYMDYNKEGISKLIVESGFDYIRDQLQLEPEVEAYLEDLKHIKVGHIDNYLPYDYKVGNNESGISAELIHTIAAVLHVSYDYIPYSSYEMMEDDLKKGKIDIITTYGTYEGYVADGFITSEPYSRSHMAAIGHRSNPIMAHTLYDLNDSVIALIKDSWQEILLQKNRIDYKPLYVNNVHEAMNAVNNNEADYAIESLWTFSYLMNEISYDNLRPTGEIELYDSKHLLLREEDKALKIILDSVIGQVNLKKHEEDGLYANYQIQSTYEFYELLTVTLFLLLCFIGIYIAFLINRLNLERQKAENANRSKSEFLAKMSHEIRTPLTAIMGYINLLSRSENITGKEKQQLKIAYNSSNILIHLVNDILDFSKIEAGKVKLVEHDFNLRLMINNAVNIIGVMAEEKNLEFVVKLDIGLPKYVVGDERRLEQILINILSNSVKFTDEGMVELSISPEHYEDHVRLNFIIRDTGKGMKPETINMIFDAFEQEDNSISRRYGGTGLGLYISKDFIERMGGEIKVSSDIGQGTEFSFYTIHQLASEVEESSEQGSYRSLKELKGMKVLLVEDNDINQMIIRDILVDMGLKVIITNNGAEALEVVNGGFDFVLMDIQMPVMNGLMAVKIMKKRQGLNHIPIIALTANVMPEQIESYYNEGFDAYCSKPIMVNELSQTLLQMYEKYHINEDEVSSKNVDIYP